MKLGEDITTSKIYGIGSEAVKSALERAEGPQDEFGCRVSMRFNAMPERANMASLIAEYTTTKYQDTITGVKLTVGQLLALLKDPNVEQVFGGWDFSPKWTKGKGRLK